MNNLKVFLLIFSLLFLPAYCEEENITPAQQLPYNYSSTYAIPIKLSITQDFSTKNPLNEGDTITFIVRENANYNGQTIVRKGEKINAKIETIITAGMNGFPAEIIIDDFNIPGIKKSQLQSTYIKKGQNRCFWVYPLKWALTPIPFVGSLTNLIKGGHANLTTSDEVIIYYYPKWL